MNQEISALKSAAILVQKDLHVFHKLNRWLAYGRVSGIVLELNEREANVLKSTIDSGMVDAGVPYAVDVIARCALEISKRRVVKQLPVPPHSVQLIMTDACNLGCTYCYGMYYLNDPKSRMMSTSTVAEVLDFAHLIGARDIGFFGGEPLANFKAIKFALEYAGSKGYKFTYGMTTNATLISSEVVDFLEKYSVAVSVSLDGDKEMHDKSRVHKNGKGTYDQVVRGIKLLKAKDCLDLVEVTYSAIQEKSVKHAVKAAGEFSSCVSCTCVEGRGNACFSKEVVKGEKLKQYYRDMFDMFVEKNDGTVAMGGINELVSNVLSEIGLTKEHVCSALLSRVTVGIDGTVYPCPETMSSGFEIGASRSFKDLPSFMMARDLALEGAKKKDVQEHWFANLTDICIARLSEDGDGKTSIEDVEAIGDALEEVIARTVDYVQSQNLYQ